MGKLRKGATRFVCEGLEEKRRSMFDKMMEKGMFVRKHELLTLMIEKFFHRKKQFVRKDYFDLKKKAEDKD